jgi:tetratricopeptide (TPR) repeat protein
VSARQRRSVGASLLAGLVLLASTRAGAAESAAVDLGDIRGRLDAVDASLKDTEGRLDYVERQYVGRKDESDEQVMAERFGKGSALYEDGDYANASILLYDLVGTERFKQSANYDDALYYLADALYQQANYLGARTYFRQLLQLRRGHERAALVGYLEVAGKLNDYTDIEHFVQQARQSNGTLPSEVAYVYGKWLFKRTDLPLSERSKRSLEALAPAAADPANAEARMRANYLIGVISVQQGNYDEAIEAFQKVAHEQPSGKRQVAIVELAHLAVGRIAYEQSRYTDAIDAYQEVDRRSENFVPALYEIAWVYVKKGDFDKALRATDLLSEVAPDSIIAPDARILQGHLLLKLTRYAEAADVYKKVINEYGPIYQEVDALLKLHDDPVQYFDDLLASGDKDFNVTSLLPPAAAKWATTQQEVAGALQVATDLGQSRKGVADSNAIAVDILKSIEQKGVNAFPVLQSGYAEAEAVDAALTRDEQVLVQVRQALLGGKLGDLQAQIDAARKERLALEDRFNSLPKSTAELSDRKERYRKALERLDLAVFGLQRDVKDFLASLDAIEKWVSDTRATRKTDPAAEREFMANVRGTRDETKEIAVALGDLKKVVEDEKLRSGNVSDDEAVRLSYQGALDREKAIMAQAQATLPPDTQALVSKTADVDRRLANDRARVAAAKQTLQAAVASKADNIRRQVQEEQAKLVGYNGDVDTQASNARNLVGRIAFESFKRVEKQFYDLVLKADVGMVDVAWTKKQDDTNKIQTLSKQKDRELKSLDDEFKEVLKDVD